MTISDSRSVAVKPNHRGSPQQRHRSARGEPRVLVFMEATEFGGPAKNLASTSNLLAEFAEFRVVTFIRGNAPSTEFTKRMVASGVPMEVIREGFRYDPRSLATVRRIITEYQPDIVQIHNGKSRLFVYLLRQVGLLERFRSIDCYHGETWTDTKQLVYNKIDRWLFKRARNIITVSKRQVEFLESLGIPRSRVTAIPNGIQLCASSLREPNDPLHVITVGRLSREKGHANLLEAVMRLRVRGISRFRVSIVGSGPEMESLKHDTARYGIDDMVGFAGYRRDTTAFYEAADLFVLPSLSEGAPNVLLEAAVHHVPVVTTDVGGVPETFEAGHEALVVPPADVGALADAMERCLVDPALRQQLAVAARARVERQFTDVQRAQRFMNYYRSLLSKPL